MQEVDDFWRLIGMRTSQLSPEDHDRLVAGHQGHLPHAVAAAVVAIQSDQSLRLAGKGFLDSTRIASGDAAMWRDILIDNRDNVRDGIHRLQKVLDELLVRLDRQELERVKDWLKSAANTRDEWMREKLEELNSD